MNRKPASRATASTAARLHDRRAATARVDLVDERQALTAAAAEGGARRVAPTTVRTDQDRFPMRATDQAGASKYPMVTTNVRVGSFQERAAATPRRSGMMS